MIALSALAALVLAIGTEHRTSVSVIYPTTVSGVSRVVAVERLAARYEQASGAAEHSMRAEQSDGNDADVVARCGDPGADQILFIKPTTLTMLSSPARVQLLVQATLVRCSDKRIARSSRQVEIAGRDLEGPSVSKGYAALEASVISDLLPRESP